MTFIHTLIDRKVRRIEIGASVVALLMVLALCGCGGSSTSTTKAKTSGLAKRVLVSNQFSNVVQLLDAQKDAFTTTIAVNAPTKMITRSIVTAVVDSSTNTVAFIDNPSETVKVQPAMPGTIDDIALSSDAKTCYVAMRNLGLLAIINVPDGTFTTEAIPGIARLVLGPNNSKLLGFSDDAQNLPTTNANAFYVIDAVSHVAVSMNPSLGTLVGAQPFNAVFVDSSHAFILNCAQECGGTATAASIQELNLTTPLPTLGGPIAGMPANAGATVGLLSGSSLFIAGTPSAGTGSLVVFNTSTNTFSPVLAIQDGLHNRIALTSNNRLFVGSQNCLAAPSGTSFQGCLAILDTAKGFAQTSLTFPVFSGFRNNFSVTGMQPISGRNVIYVIEGGELDIFDITTNALTPTQLDISGKAIDVALIDP